MTLLMVATVVGVVAGALSGVSRNREAWSTFWLASGVFVATLIALFLWDDRQLGGWLIALVGSYAVALTLGEVIACRSRST